MRLVYVESWNSLLIFFSSCDYDIISISETWLHDGVLVKFCIMLSISLDILNSFDLKQYNVFPTCGESVLELVITDNLVTQVQLSEKATTSTHRALEVSVEVDDYSIPTNDKQRVVYNYKKADFCTIIQVLSYISWGGLSYFKNIDDAFGYFYDMLYATITDHVPTVKIRQNKFPHWYDHEIITMINEKERIRRRYIKKGRDQTSTEYRRFCELRASIKTKQEILYNVNINKIGDGMKTNPKRFWSFVNQKKSSSSLPKVMKYNNVLYKTSKAIATAFNNYFKSVFHPPVPEAETLSVNCPWRHVNNFTIPHISPESLLSEIKNALS